jgi:hypothetical protein
MDRLRGPTLLILLFVALLGVGCGPSCGVDPSQTSQTNVEIRKWYKAQLATIPEQNEQWIAEGLSAEERARRAYAIRHEARIEARERMPNKMDVAELRARDRAKYGNPDGPTFEYLVERNRKKGLEGDAIYEAIIESSARSNEKVNKSLGL